MAKWMMLGRATQTLPRMLRIRCRAQQQEHQAWHPARLLLQPALSWAQKSINNGDYATRLQADSELAAS